MYLKNDSLNWDVETRPVYVDGVKVEGYQAVRRDDNHAVLGIHGARYTAVPNHTIRDLAEVFSGEAGASIRGSWSIGGGKTIGMQLEDGTFRIPGDPSEYRDFFVLANSHDGSRPVMFHPTQVRIVCQNTFYASLRQKQGAGYVFRHTSSVHGRIEEVRKALLIAQRDREDFTRWAEEMQAQGIDRARFVDGMIPLPAEILAGVAHELGAAERAILEARDTLQAVIHRPTQDDIRESAWGLWNAGVEYLDHFQNPRRKTRTHEGRKLLRTIGLAPGKEIVRGAIAGALI